jgi:hypothetical protein
MPATQSRSATERANARRRARQVAKGEQPLPEDEVVDATPAGGGGPRPPTFLTRLFPPAPPLPGKGDPLAGFTYTGRFRGIVSSAWLLFRHPLPWGIAAACWALLQYGLLLTGSQSVISFALTLGQYALLIGAGWFGWWRPWLFGLAAGLGGTLVLGLIVGLQSIVEGAGVGGLILAILTTFVAWGVLFSLVGAFAGFYGGYLRRRMAIPTAKNAPKGKRR